MVKYHFRVYDKDTNDLLISSIVPQEYIFDWIDKYSSFGIIKSYILTEESEDK